MIDYNDKKSYKAADEEGGESGGKGGKGGAIEFRDFISTRSDQLSSEEERQLLAIHKGTSGELIEKQKKTRDQRQDKKEGKTAGNQYGVGMGAREAAFLKHPILGEAAEFDGVDPQVNQDPTLYEAETNSEKKKELTYEYQLRLGLENQPKFNPKPSPL